MLTFLNVPTPEINCTCRMFAHHSCVIPFTKITMFPYSEQVQDIEHYGASVGDEFWMLNELIQANEKVFMNFWYIEH